MWLRPAETMRQLLESGRARHVFALAAAVGVQNALWVAEQESLGDHGPASAIVLLGCAIGAVSGIVSLYITAGLLTWLGRRMGGDGNGRRLRAAVAWSAVPVVWTILLWIPKAAILGDRVFRSPEPVTAGNPFLVAVYGLETAARLWPIVLLVICVAEAHRLPLRRALAAVAVVFLVLLLAAVVVQLIVGAPGVAPLTAFEGFSGSATIL